MRSAVFCAGSKRAAPAMPELVAGGHDRLGVPSQQLRAGDQRCDLLLLDHLPVDERLDVGMIDVDDHHLRGAPRRAAGLDRPGGPVADLEEAHQPRGSAAAGQPLAVAAQGREVRAGARAVLEEPRLPDPEVHDPALVDEIVGDALDEAGVGLGPLVGRGRGSHLSGRLVDVEMPLGGAVDAVGPVQPGIEPLRRVRRGHLLGQHVAKLVHEGPGVALGREIAALPAPVGPGPGQPVENLLGIGLAALPLVLGEVGQRLLVGHAPRQPGRHALLPHRPQPRRNAGLPEIFLGEDIDRHLRPGGGHLRPLETEHHRPVGIADLAARHAERNRRVG